MCYDGDASEYEKVAEQFNLTEFNADQWVVLATDAGMKYIIITAKQHEGFAMFKSDASPYDIVDATPFGRDPLKVAVSTASNSECVWGGCCLFPA